MYFLSVLPLALTASALLVPTEVHTNQIHTIPPSTEHIEVALECNGCPIALDEHRWALPAGPGFDSVLHADAEVKGDKVLFNNQQVYPPSIGIPLSIKQTTDKKDLATFNGLIPISTSIDHKPVEFYSDGETSLFIHPVFIEILALGDHVVHAETVELRIAEIDGKLSLLRARVRPYEPSPYTDSCTTVWCRVKGTIARKYNEWRAAATKKISSWKGGCSKSKPGRISTLPIKGGPNKYGGSLRPGIPHRKPPHGHHGHHQQHGFRAFVRYLVRSVFLPAFFGLSAGIIIGAFAWLIVNEIRKIRAVRRGDYIVVEQIEVEEGRASMDGPPKYEDVYRVPQEETEDEKKELLQ